MRKMSRSEAKALSETGTAGVSKLGGWLQESLERDKARLDKARQERVQALLDAAAAFDKQAEVKPGKKERAGHRRAARLAEENRAKAAALLEKYKAEAES